MKRMDKVYLGAAVYVECDGDMLTLTVEYGYGPVETICMDPGVCTALMEYMGQAMKEEEGGANVQ